jgi:Holliday junction resolvase RusA-like endonuclease
VLHRRGLIATVAAGLRPLAHEVRAAAVRGPVVLPEPRACACSLHIDIVCSVPKSATKRFAAQALAGHARPTKKPDADNVLKAICDGMNGVVWKDDVQAVEVRLSKRYGSTPGVRVRVEALVVGDLLGVAA